MSPLSPRYILPDPPECPVSRSTFLSLSQELFTHLIKANPEGWYAWASSTQKYLDMARNIMETLTTDLELEMQRTYDATTALDMDREFHRLQRDDHLQMLGYAQSQCELFKSLYTNEIHEHGFLREEIKVVDNGLDKLQKKIKQLRAIATMPKPDRGRNRKSKGRRAKAKKEIIALAEGVDYVVSH
ncbi:MAG: hypothetical protein M1814_001967 [Vezdaea aestivalis]|nr:MAG: hypothetical protein M1814_001967 [Vezdaea aestivalis]